ncbi:9418_t:CDS:2 [Funneliformis caledonium]|uniref:9418_t:CDS:1 n=1 Tax=Funneliformis caledonium TaxID=1117310 RepID=A0A9N9GG90_9GLOM|nr:9418_t:CDS:2 [Funneliformis caledonium]
MEKDDDKGDEDKNEEGEIEEGDEEEGTISRIYFIDHLNNSKNQTENFN